MPEIKMPKLSPTMEIGKLSAWLVKIGDVVKQGDVIAEIETDKAIMELESTASGKIIAITEAGQDLEVNSIIGYILTNGEEQPESLDFNSKSINEMQIKIPTNLKNENIIIKKDEVSRIIASPLAKKIAQDRNINLSEIQGSGPNGRIVMNDVENYDNMRKMQKNNINISAMQSLDAKTKILSLTSMRKIIAQKLTLSKQERPHIYLQKKIMMDKLEDVKNEIFEKFAEKISFTPFFIKATALALRDNLIINRTYDNNELIQHYDFNISIAVTLEDGLITPVIRNADEKSIKNIAQDLIELTEKAKNGRLKLDEITGGTFSISNLGMYEIDSFNAILNPPQVGILAIASIFTEAVFDGNIFVPRKIMKAVLSCDHRIVDGAQAAKFMQSLAKYIENPAGMLL